MSIEKITKIALTGGIASGKTYVSDFIKELGISIIDLDVISREITRKNINNIISIFGKKITTNSQFDKEKLKQLVFNDALEMQKLEDFMHPKILQEMQNEIEKLETLHIKKVIVVVPLLIEKNLYSYFDSAIVVLTDKKIQKQRMIIRDKIDETLAEDILNKQATNEQRREITKYIPTQCIENNSTIAVLNQQINNLNL